MEFLGEPQAEIEKYNAIRQIKKLKNIDKEKDEER